MLFWESTRALGPFSSDKLISLLAWISNYINYEVLGEITYSFVNSNGCTVEVWKLVNIISSNFGELTSNFIPFLPLGEHIQERR